MYDTREDLVYQGNRSYQSEVPLELPTHISDGEICIRKGVLLTVTYRSDRGTIRLDFGGFVCVA